MLVNYLFATISSTFVAYKNPNLNMAFIHSDTSLPRIIQR
jgi:hypothetical protein